MRQEANRPSVASRSLLLVLLTSVLALPGCFTFQHTVGAGPAGNEVAEDTQWFALYGLVPVGEVDSLSLAGVAQDYRVTTKFTFWDVVITSFTSFFTFYRQHVIVEQ